VISLVLQYIGKLWGSRRFGIWSFLGGLLFGPIDYVKDRSHREVIL
jgi:hypothetical protein